MKLLLLGISDASLPQLVKLEQTERFHVLGWHESESCNQELRELFPAGRQIRSAEEFERTALNAIVVVANGGNTDNCEILVRNLARDSMPLVLIQPACSAIFAAELDMIQRDTGAPMIPIHLDSLHPAIDFLANATRTWDENSPIGKLEQIVMERNSNHRDDDTVRSHVAKDALLLRRLIGKFQKVGAMQAGPDKSLANLSMHLTGQSPAITKWSIGPVNDSVGATVSLVGERGRVTLQMPEQGEWRLSTTAQPDEFLSDVPMEYDSLTAMVHQIHHGLDGDTMQPNWEDAYRAIDLADTASESVRRGKTLIVSNARLTEEDTFKSMMAAGGCLIILILPFLFLLISLIDGLQIPYAKSLRVRADAGDRSVPLPPDLNVLEKVTLTSNEAELQLLTSTELYQRFGIRETGTPEAFAANRNAITLAPIPDKSCELVLDYEGSFNIWKGWPLVMLMPILFFLMLQLLKFVFPKPASTITSTGDHREQNL